MRSHRVWCHGICLSLSVATLLVGGCGVAANGADAAPASVAKVAISSTPEKYYTGALGNAKSRMTGKYTGDSWTWHARFPMHGFIDSYRATRDVAWLDAAARYFDWNISLLLKGPDGHMGWLGPVSGAPTKISEHPIGDAIMLEPMVRFSELVLKDEPALAKRFGRQARNYVTLARKLMFEKWEARGIWHVDGPYGVFTEWPWYYTEAEADRWHAPPPEQRAITLPHNMQVHWAITAARIYRVTGEKPWREKAMKLFRFTKSRLCLYNDHYSWNYWDPFGPWDIDPTNPQKFRHWVGTHAYRDYQITEVREMVEAFHRGLAFDAADMKRLVATNTRVMWTGDLDDIKWNNSDAGVKKAALGEVRLASKPAGIFNRYAGTLWTPLVDFDATVRKIHERQIKPGSSEYALYYNVIAAKKPSYERHYPGDKVTMFDVPLSSCSTLAMAAPIPSTIGQGKSSVLACFTRVPGELTIDLRSADGKTTLREITKTTRPAAGIFNLTWEAKDVKPGTYRVRWTLKGESREFPIEIR